MTSQELRFYDLLEQLSILTNKSEWWLWKRLGGKEVLDNCELGLMRHKIDLYLNSFNDVFDNQWWSSYCKKQGNGNAPDPFGVFGGQSPIKRILRLGECIYNLHSKGQVSDSLIERLRNRKSFWAAATEIEIASCFIQAGFDLELYPVISTGSRPDGKVVIEGVDIFYEITEQHWSNYEKETVQQESRIIDWLSKKCEYLDGSIHFKAGDKNVASKVDELLVLLRKHRKQRSLDPLPFQFENDDFKVYIRRSESSSGWIGISGLESTPEEIVRRWIAQLFRKARQLPPRESGVIIGSPLFLWGPDQVRSAHYEVQRELEGGSHKRVSGIILCAKHVEHSGFVKHIPSVIINSNALFDNAKRVDKMSEALFHFPDWL